MSKRRLRWLAGLLALVVIAAVVVVISQSGGTEGLTLTSVAGAAERTVAEPGGSMETEITYGVSGGSKPVTATGEGVFDSRTGRARIELSVAGVDGSPLQVESVGNEKTSFVSSRVLSEELPPGKEWLGMEPLLGNDPTTALGAGGGAKGSLEMLRAVGGNVERVGEETVRGENTTRYKGTVDLSQAAKKFAAEDDPALARLYREVGGRLSGPMPVEVWIGIGGLVRRERLVERIPAEGGQSLAMHLSIEFFDFAAHPDIALPPRHEVLDYTPVLRAELGMMDGTSLGPLKSAPGATALPVPAFRRRATGICRATLAKDERLGRQREPDRGGTQRIGTLKSDGERAEAGAPRDGQLVRRVRLSVEQRRDQGAGRARTAGQVRG